MTSYHQYCPIARGAEIFAERWTPLIIRNLYLGCRTFTEILDGAPGMSKTLLTERLRALERSAVVERHQRPNGRGATYHLTPAGVELVDVCIALGNWGARWLEVARSTWDRTSCSGTWPGWPTSPAFPSRGWSSDSISPTCGGRTVTG